MVNLSVSDVLEIVHVALHAWVFILFGVANRPCHPQTASFPFGLPIRLYCPKGNILMSALGHSLDTLKCTSKLFIIQKQSFDLTLILLSFLLI